MQINFLVEMSIITGLNVQIFLLYLTYHLIAMNCLVTDGRQHRLLSI